MGVFESGELCYNTRVIIYKDKKENINNNTVAKTNLDLFTTAGSYIIAALVKDTVAVLQHRTVSNAKIIPISGVCQLSEQGLHRG